MKLSAWTILGLGGILLWGGVAAPAQDKAGNLKKLKEEIGLLGAVIDQSLTQSFGSPFGVLDKARGAYLPGYGAVFSFEVNLTPKDFATPFAPQLSAERERKRNQEEARQREAARGVAERALADFGHSLSHLAPQESVAIVIHTVSVRPQGIERGTIVITGPKQLLDDFRANRIDRDAFLRRLAVTEY